MNEKGFPTAYFEFVHKIWEKRPMHIKSNEGESFGEGVLTSQGQPSVQLRYELDNVYRARD